KPDAEVAKVGRVAGPRQFVRVTLTAEPAPAANHPPHQGWVISRPRARRPVLAIAREVADAVRRVTLREDADGRRSLEPRLARIALRSIELAVVRRRAASLTTRRRLPLVLGGQPVGPVRLRREPRAVGARLVPAQAHDRL